MPRKASLKAGDPSMLTPKYPSPASLSADRIVLSASVPLLLSWAARYVDLLADLTLTAGPTPRW